MISLWPAEMEFCELLIVAVWNENRSNWLFEEEKRFFFVETNQKKKKHYR